MEPSEQRWMTKPTDRFVLKWIKVHLSSRVTPRLLGYGWLRPWMITVTSSALGVVAGIIFALGAGFTAAFVAAVAQVLDGVDGQFARLTRRESDRGAFLDSVLDRYADGAMVIGTVIYLVRLPSPVSLGLLLVLGSLALIGGNLISYSSARAENLAIETGGPTLASKGTRMTVMVLCGWGTLFWPAMPIIAILYLAVHTNIVVFRRLIQS